MLLFFAQHIFNTEHVYGYIQDIMKILHTVNKGTRLNTLEKFHIYELKKQGTQLNDTFADMTDPMFDTLIQACKRKQV
jgi:hypothetical protein